MVPFQTSRHGLGLLDDGSQRLGPDTLRVPFSNGLKKIYRSRLGICQLRDFFGQLTGEVATFTTLYNRSGLEVNAS